VASQERLEYFISAAFKDDGVRQAMQAFGKLNAESAKVVNELDRISKASAKAGASIRDSRTGFAQLGMQVNQFGTQIASGTSVTTAFVQQIGDVGWAMSGMKGALGAVGSFLAGPWGVAVMGAAFVLDKLLNTTDGGEAVNKKYEASLQNARDALFSYRVETAKTRDELINLYETQLIGIEIQWRKAATDVGAYGHEVQRTQRILDTWVNKPLWLVGKAWMENKRAVEEYNKAQEAERNSYAQMIGAQTAFNKLKKGFAAEDARNSARSERAADKAEREREAAARKAEQQHENEVNSYERLSNKLREIVNLKTSSNEGIGRAKNELADFQKLVGELTTATIDGKPVGAELLGQLAPQILEINVALTDAANGMQEWMTAIPTASEAAMKAWQDQHAVIDELWRLYVVQQIVGFVTKLVGNLIGGGPVTDKMGGGTLLADFDKAFGNNANGTPSWKGGLTWVGERGPELVNLPRGAGVIPAHRASQMSGGGMTINVDARGSSDPAAVRAQVQQGILEAAPALIAAAQQRTITSLRRPKLGGAMQ
jgi:hypothetical protein